MAVLSPVAETWTLRAFAVAVCALAGGALLGDLAGRDPLGLGAAVATGRVVPRATAERLVDRPISWRAERLCRRDVMLATGMIAAGTLDAIIRAGDIGRVPGAVRGLEGAARKFLECSPGEGIGWAWLAMAKSQTDASDEEVRALFERSQWTAPSDLWVITFRLPEIARSVSQRGGGFADLARADIRTLLSAEKSGGSAADILGPVFRWVGGIAQEEFRRIEDPVEREALIQAFGRQRANIAGCTPERFADWLYRDQRGSCLTGDRIPVFEWQKSDKAPASTERPGARPAQ